MLQPVDDANGSISHFIINDPRTIVASTWLRKLVGDDYFQRVARVVDLPPNAVDEDIVTALGNLSGIEYVILRHDRQYNSLTSAEIRNLCSRIQRVCDAEVY